MIAYPLVGNSTRRDMELMRLLILQFTIIGSCLLLSEGRLLEKTPDKDKTTPEPDLVRSTIYKRVARKVFYKLKDLSNEEGETSEVNKGNGKTIRYVTKIGGTARTQAQLARVARQSNDHHKIAYDKKISVPDNTKPKKVFIKKPIPKFYELDDENDFQNNIDKVPAKLMDSAAEHEDEDFNVDDYDFDVNHDEFVGRGKPLEPRLKKLEDKVLAELRSQEDKTKATPTPVTPPVIPNEKVVITPQPKQNVKKREYPAIVPYKPNLRKDDDYSNEFPSSSTDKSPNKTYDDEGEDADDDDDEDEEDAGDKSDREGDRKARATRTISNKRYVNKLDEKLLSGKAAEDIPMFTHLTHALSDNTDYSLEDYQTWNIIQQNADSMSNRQLFSF